MVQMMSLKSCIINPGLLIQHDMAWRDAVTFFLVGAVHHGLATEKELLTQCPIQSMDVEIY